MEVVGQAKKVTILVQSEPYNHGKQAHLRILERLKAGGVTSAAVFRATAALDDDSMVHTMRLAEVVPDLPFMIIWIDHPERVDRRIFAHD